MDLVDCVVVGMKTELNCYSIFFSCIVEISFLSINFSNNLPKLGSKLIARQEDIIHFDMLGLGTMISECVQTEGK